MAARGETGLTLRTIHALLYERRPKSGKEWAFFALDMAINAPVRGRRNRG
jgi:hypothetical protein